MQTKQDEPAAIVLAAGKSTRMNSELPKVLHELSGQPLLAYVLAALEEAGIHRKLVVVGFGADLVKGKFSATPGVEFILQAEQKGTGHAAMVCRANLAGHRGPVVVIAGDQPMLRPELLSAMLKRFHETSAKALMATAIVKEPFGLGRIVRDPAGKFTKIVEQKDATPEQAKICEINPSFYVFDGPSLFQALDQVRPNNAQGEYYLTDVPGILGERGETVVAEPLADEVDMFGINHRRHLAEAHALMQSRIQGKLLDAGVTIVDPRNTFIDARAVIGKDTVILPFSVIGGPVEIGSGCRIGPFAHVRENCRLADRVEVGAFVEVVRSHLGEQAMVRHHAYLGDAMVGAQVKVGAGVITANFDGMRKNQTHIGAKAFLGSGAVLIAPVTIGPEATIGAGSVVTKNHDVPAGRTAFGVPARVKAKEG